MSINTPLSRATNAVARLAGDDEPIEYWNNLVFAALNSYLQPEDDIVTDIAKAIYTYRCGGNWDNMDARFQERIWKAEAKAVLAVLRKKLVP